MCFFLFKVFHPTPFTLNPLVKGYEGAHMLHHTLCHTNLASPRRYMFPSSSESNMRRVLWLPYALFFFPSHAVHFVSGKDQRRSGVSSVVYICRVSLVLCKWIAFGSKILVHRFRSTRYFGLQPLQHEPKRVVGITQNPHVMTTCMKSTTFTITPFNCRVSLRRRHFLCSFFICIFFICDDNSQNPAKR